MTIMSVKKAKIDNQMELFHNPEIVKEKKIHVMLNGIIEVDEQYEVCPISSLND